MPKVTGVLPEFAAAGVDQDSIIKIQFNKAVNPESFGDFSCVSVYTSDGSVLDYFETPYFSSDNTVLFVQPKQDLHLITPDSNKKLDVSVLVDLTNAKDKDGLPIAQNEAHTYRIKESFGNQEKVKFLVKTVEGTGSFLSDGEKECTAGYTVDLQFTVNKDDYLFNGLEAVSTADGSSRGEAVSFKILESNPETGVYKIQVRIMENLEDILIQPVCLAYPAVTSYSPNKKDEENFANTPIEITFNMPMGSAESAFDFANVLLTVNGTSVASYFTKAFNPEKTILTLTPKTDELISFITSKSVAFIEVKVALSDSISVTNGEHILPLKQNKDSTFTVKYKGKKDETPPKKLEFFVTRHPITLETANTIADEDKFLLETFTTSDSQNYDKALKNKCNGTFYIYGKYFGNGRTIKSVCVKDSSATDGTIFNTQNAEFSTDESGNTIFCLKCTTNTKYAEYGYSMDLKCYVTDSLGNSSENIDFTFYQKPLSFENKILIYNFDLLEGESFSREDYEANRKILKITYDPVPTYWYNDFRVNTDYSFLYDGYNQVYKNGATQESYLEYFDSYIFECEYMDDSGVVRHGKFTNNKEQMLFQYELQNVQKLNGFKLKLSVTDELQNHAETEIVFPVPSVITGIESVSGKADKKINFEPVQASENNKICMKRSQFLVHEEDSKLKYSGIDDSYSNKQTMKAGVSYNVVPCNYVQYRKQVPNLNSGELETRFAEFLLAGDLSEEVYSTTYNLETVPDVELVEGTPTYKRSDGSYSNYMDITIEIAEDSWEKFDKIYVDEEAYSFKKDEYSLVLQHPDKASIFLMCLRDTTFTVYGVKNGVRSNGKACTIPKLSGSENDYKEPTIKIERKNSDYFKITISDEDGSGPDSGSLWNIKDINGNYKYVLNESNGFTIDVPVWEIEELSDSSFKNSNYIFIYVEGYDKKGNKGNSYNGMLHTDFILEKYKIDKTSNDWTFSCLTASSASNLVYHKLKFNTLESGEKKYFWDETPNRGSRTGSGLTKYKFNSIPSDIFIKIFRYDSDEKKTDYDTYSPLYYYTGAWNTGDYDLIIPNGSSKTSVGISSDAPVFVQTLVTSRPYSECSQWTPEKWEFNRRHFGEKQLNFSSSDKIAKRYAIPVDEIASGECYCVIAHFADGTSTQSQVWQK